MSPIIYEMDVEVLLDPMTLTMIKAHIFDSSQVDVCLKYDHENGFKVQCSQFKA